VQVVELGLEEAEVALQQGVQEAEVALQVAEQEVGAMAYPGPEVEAMACPEVAALA
jgi:hypothetical protein